MLISSYSFLFIIRYLNSELYNLKGMDFIGSVVSLGCGEVLGTYQGKVAMIDQDAQTVTIEKAFRNGIQCSVPQVTIK